MTDVILKNPAGSRLFDAKYTMDNLDRVTVAAEGNYSAGNITTATRGDQWALTQTGNWDNNKLNLNGDADYTDSGEWDADATFNNANEMSTSDNYASLTYDANGNLTDEGTGNYDYVYDAWNRLRFVKTQAGATVAEYRYNGINHRLAWHYDIDADADTDSNDNWVYFVHDDRWRIVATYRGNGAGSSVDSNPKERFVFHAAGDDGNGGSCYIDTVILRDRDNSSGWNSASDNALEERRYYIQNWRADVVALIKDTRAIVERIKYSAYGLPFNLPMGDADCDGDTDATDVTQINNWIGLGYQALGDTDLDGDVDLTDKNNADANKITTGRGTLSYSGVKNRVGYAGYQYAHDLSGTKWHVRARVFMSECGRWCTRDQLEYKDGMGLYVYVGDRPIKTTDPFGEEGSSPSHPCEDKPCKESIRQENLICNIKSSCRLRWTNCMGWTGDGILSDYKKLINEWFRDNPCKNVFAPKPCGANCSCSGGWSRLRCELRPASWIIDFPAPSPLPSCKIIITCSTLPCFMSMRVGTCQIAED